MLVRSPNTLAKRVDYTTIDVFSLTDRGKFQLYLIASYCYYERDISIISDHVFDMICKQLLDSWDSWDHPHKWKIRKGDLSAGTGYNIDYPTIVKGAAESYLKQLGD